MFDMDLSGLNHSPTLSENAGSWSWAAWGIENNTLENNNELSLCGLVEDKEIAARAVAFVVNSTRKGIVPLCADVANLLRSKQSLEKKVRFLKRENDVLRSSASLSFRPSDSTSPTPASLSSHNSYTETCIKALQEAQDHYNRSSSRCSNCSSTLSYSPKIDKSHDRLSGMQYSPTSSRDSNKQGSSKSIHSVHSGFKEVNAMLEKGGFQFSSHLLNQKIDPLVDEAICMDDGIAGNDNVSTDNISQNFERGDKSVGNESKSHSKEDNHFETRVDVHVSDSDEISNRQQETCPSSEKNCFSFHIENEITKQIKGKDSNRMCEQTNVNNVPNSDKGKSGCIELLKSDSEIVGENLETKESEKEVPASTCRRRSLPEVIGTPNTTAYKVSAKISKQTQCSLIHQAKGSMEEQFVKTVKTNTKLSEELSHARKEIEALKQKLKQVEEMKREKNYEDVIYKRKDEEKMLEDNGYYTSSNKTTRQSSVNKKSSPKRVSATPVSYAGPIPGCKCSSCQEGLGSDDDMSHYSDHLMEEEPRYAVNSKLIVQSDDHVIVKGDKSGTIRYIGHLDRSRQTNNLYVGLELDAPGGKHDGFYQGKRYFICGKERGLFVPLQDIVCKGSKSSKVVKQELSVPSSSRSKKGHRKSQASQEQDKKVTEL